jgi:hemerythrin-like domain-containing protein
MANTNEPRSNIYYLQKKIVELSREYYEAIKNNITFENIKVIFLKRKKLQDELSNIKQHNEDTNKKFERENLDSSLSLHD